MIKESNGARDGALCRGRADYDASSRQTRWKFAVIVLRYSERKIGEGGCDENHSNGPAYSPGRPGHRPGMRDDGGPNHRGGAPRLPRQDLLLLRGILSRHIQSRSRTVLKVGAGRSRYTGEEKVVADDDVGSASAGKWRNRPCVRHDGATRHGSWFIRISREEVLLLCHSVSRKV